MPFLDRLQRWAAERPHLPAVSSAEHSLTFGGLLSAAAGNTSPGTTAVCLPNSLNAAVAVIGSLAGTGRCAVLDPSWPPAQRAAVLERLRPDRLIDSTWRPASAGTEQLVDGPPESDFLVGLTSGTTAHPKAFSRTRRSWQVSLEVSGKIFGAEPGGCTLVPGPLSSGLNLYALAECLWEGTEFRTVPASGAAEILSAMESHPVTRLVIVPTQLQMLAERAMGRPHGPDAGRRLRHIVCAGAKLSPLAIAAARRWAPDAVLHEYYGSSELSFVATSALAPGTNPLPATAVGTPFPGVEVRILDDAGDPCGVGVHGNISVKGGLISNGYLWGDDGTAFRRFGEWATVGDQGFIDAQGLLHFIGRRADMIVTGGQNVYPHEVEAALQDVPGVAGIVAVGLKDSLRGAQVVAGVLPEGDRPPAAKELRRRAVESLAPAKRPRRYYLLDERPVTAAGKLSRAMLAQWIEEGDRRVRALQ